MNEIESIKQEASTYFSDISPSHDWLHVKRVANLAEELQKTEGGDLEILMLSVYLHDIGRAREDNGEIEDHATWGAKEAEKILSDYNYREKLIKEVKHCIEAHRYSNNIKPETVEAKILSDADNLDAIGASGIARTFSYSGESQQVLANLETPRDDEDAAKGETTLNHVREKLLNLKDRMYTEKGLEIAENRHKFTENFVKQFEAEMRGDL